MLYVRRKGWELPESQVTPEHMFFNRRAFMGAAAGAAVLAASRPVRAEDDPSMGLYPVKTNPKFADAGRPVTPEDVNTAFNNSNPPLIQVTLGTRLTSTTAVSIDP